MVETQMAAPRGLQGRINEIASRPTDPSREQRLDQIRTAEAIHSGGHGENLDDLINGLLANRMSVGHGLASSAIKMRASMNTAIRQAQASLSRSYDYIASSDTMLELINELKKQLVLDENVANPRRHALLGAISSLQGLPGTTTSHPIDPATGSRITREAAGGPTALISQMIGRNADRSAPHVREYRPAAPRPPVDPEDDLFAGGRRYTRRRRYSRRR